MRRGVFRNGNVKCGQLQFLRDVINGGEEFPRVGESIADVACGCGGYERIDQGRNTGDLARGGGDVFAEAGECAVGGVAFVEGDAAGE